MTQAATLATEKLEDLNRYPSSDPNVAVTNGTSAGSLTSNDLQDVTVNGVTEAVAYYDEVFFSPSEGIAGGDNVGLRRQAATRNIRRLPTRRTAR